MSDIAIKVQNLGKSYRITHDRQGSYRTIREALTEKLQGIWGHVPNSMNFFGGKNLVRVPEISEIPRGQGRVASAEDFWALKDVSFTIHNLMSEP